MRQSILPLRIFAPLLGATLLLSAPRAAFADDPGLAVSHYVVVTNEGSIFQGELVESIAGGGVTLRLATGRILHFDASDIKSQGAAAPSLPAPVVPPIVLPPPPAPRSAPSTPRLSGLFSGPPIVYEGNDAVRVHITSRDGGGATLAEESTSGWSPVCQVPCTTSVDPKAMYQLQTLPGLTVPSDPFRFPGDKGSLELEANVQSRLHNFGWGLGLTTLAPLAMLPGIFLLSGMFDSGDGNPSTAETAVGWTIVGASAVALVAGVVFLAAPAHTTLTDSNGHRIASQVGIPLGGSVQLTSSGFVF